MPTGLGPPWGSPVHPGAAASCILVRGRQLSPADPAPSISRLLAASSPTLWLSWPRQVPGRGSPVALPRRDPVPQAGNDGQGCIARAQPWGIRGLGRDVGGHMGMHRAPLPVAPAGASICASNEQARTAPGSMAQMQPVHRGVGKSPSTLHRGSLGPSRAPRPRFSRPQDPPGGRPGPGHAVQAGTGRGTHCPGTGSSGTAATAMEGSQGRWRGHQWG